MNIGIDITSRAEWVRRLDQVPVVREVAFTPQERWWCADDPGRYAVVWAVKEATAKLLGTGFAGIGWHGIAVLPGAEAPGWLDERLCVNLSVEASSARRSAGVRGPLRCQLAWDDDGRVLAVVAGGSDRVGIDMRRVAGPGASSDGLTRAERGQAYRQAARAAGRRAVARLGSGTARWETPPDQAPSVHWAGGTVTRASFSHAAGFAAAAVAAPPNPSTIDVSAGRSASNPLIFLYDDDLLDKLHSMGGWHVQTQEVLKQPWHELPEQTTQWRRSA